MKKLIKYKLKIFLVAALVVAIVALIKPEYVENVARAFLILLGVGF